jgi:hypothetical protein
MTANEKRLTAKVLRMASDQFSNHGCNDFDLSEVIPDKDERDSLFRAYCEYNGDPSEYDEWDAPAEGADYRMQDWMVMSFMAARLEREANDEV